MLLLYETSRVWGDISGSLRQGVLKIAAHPDQSLMS